MIRRAFPGRKTWLAGGLLFGLCLSLFSFVALKEYEKTFFARGWCVGNPPPVLNLKDLEKLEAEVRFNGFRKTLTLDYGGGKKQVFSCEIEGSSALCREVGEKSDPARYVFFSPEEKRIYMAIVLSPELFLRRGKEDLKKECREEVMGKVKRVGDRDLCMVELFFCPELRVFREEEER